MLGWRSITSINNPMYAKTPTGRASKGSVSIRVSNGRLQLQFRYAGKRHYLSLGLPDTPESRKLAILKASEIEKDILYERFDPTLEKYKHQSQRQLSIVTPIKKSQPTLGELWEKYSEFKKPQVSPSTYAKSFKRHGNHIRKLPTQSLHEAQAIRDWLLSNFTPDAVKRTLCQLKACCNWGIAEGLIDANPFTAMKIKTPKGAVTGDYDVVPFTKEERDKIIAAFESSGRCYKRYANYVKFLFFTGCRPSEAIALRWKNITSSAIQFRNSVVISEHGLIEKEGLKTQKKRDFPITPEIEAILEEARPEFINPEALIFPGPKGKYLDQEDFSQGVWKKILAKLPDIPYRKCYQTRHTFITLCIESGVNSTAIARWTGTSSYMIDHHYGATNFTNLRPPSLL